MPFNLRSCLFTGFFFEKVRIASFFAVKLLTMRRYILLIIGFFICTHAWPQASVEWDYFMKSTFRNHDKEDCGEGGLQRVKARLNIPMSVKLDKWGQPRIWNVTLSATHGWLENEGLTEELNPSRIINASVNVSHIRNISKDWMLIASLGVGIYAPTDYISFKSVLASGGAIFAYRLTDNFKIGVGVGLTNSYGTPMVVPMGYLDWSLRGRVEVLLNLSNGVKTSVKIKATDWLTVDVKPIEFDGMSAVVKRDGKDKLYSMFMIRSNLSLDFKMGKHFSIFAGAGGALLRNSSIKDRKIGSLFGGDDKDKYRFKATPQFLAGIRYKF